MSRTATGLTGRSSPSGLGHRTLSCSKVAATKDKPAQRSRSKWRSVYKIHSLADAETTFVFTSGGHNAGIVSEPGHQGRSYQIATRQETDKYVDPETWQAATRKKEGSWWPDWQEWLAKHSGGTVPPPSIGAPQKGYPILGEAPGNYVLQQ